jgi:outer membrane lipoprotein SlyB
MEIEITWGKVVRVWWAYAWRSFIAVFCGAIGGALVGGVLGFAMGAFGVSLTAIQLIVASIGFLIGLALSVVPMKLILGKDFGEFRLVLVSKGPSPQVSTAL